MQIYSFFNSSTSYRVRIALALKGLPYDYQPVNIRVGEHCAADYVVAINPRRWCRHWWTGTSTWASRWRSSTTSTPAIPSRG